MSMITEQINRLRKAADFRHTIGDYMTAGLHREAADTIEQLAAKVREENGGGWIPIAEPTVKPIPNIEVLCCNQRGDILIGYLFEDKESNTGYSAESEECYLMDCVAWKPLPEPYKEEK